MKKMKPETYGTVIAVAKTMILKLRLMAMVRRIATAASPMKKMESLTMIKAGRAQPMKRIEEKRKLQEIAKTTLPKEQEWWTG